MKIIRVLFAILTLSIFSIVGADMDNGLRLYSLGRYKEAFNEFKIAADKGNPEGQFRLGLLYYYGLGISEDRLKSLELFRSASNKGNAKAQCMLGQDFIQNKKFLDAKVYAQKAANQGESCGYYLMGVIYENGFGIGADLAKARMWYRKSAEGRYNLASLRLGIIYLYGIGVKVDHEEASSFLYSSSDDGNATADYYLGMMVLKGWGTKIDYSKAMQYFRSASDNDVLESNTAIAYMYENGLGVSQDKQVALGYYRKAAAQGDADAKAAVARLNAAAAQPAPRPTATTPLPTDTTKKRVALLIGNQAYPSSRLNNPINDVNKLSSTLKSLGFTVTVKTDLNRRDLLSTVRTFLNTIDRNTVSFLYYSGHGMEVGGRNYLIPIDFDAATPEEIDDQGVDIQKLYDGLPSKAAGSDNFLVLDACRNNPLAVTKSLSDSGGVKAVAMRAPFIDTNLVVAYAASSGQKASDGVGNSPYVLALNTALLTPNISWNTVLGNVSTTLRASSQGRQVPAYLTQGGFEFVFNRR